MPSTETTLRKPDAPEGGRAARSSRRNATKPRAGAAVLLGLAIATGAGCRSPKPSYLFVEPEAGSVSIELRREVGVFERREVPVPLSDCGFFAVIEQDRDRLARLPPQEIWRVSTLDPDAVALSIRYGVVPPGFVQVRPHGRPAPPLVPGDRYVVECTGYGIGVTEFVLPYPERPEGFAGEADLDTLEGAAPGEAAPSGAGG